MHHMILFTADDHICFFFIFADNLSLRRPQLLATTEIDREGGGWDEMRSSHDERREGRTDGFFLGGGERCDGLAWVCVFTRGRCMWLICFNQICNGASVSLPRHHTNSYTISSVRTKKISEAHGVRGF